MRNERFNWPARQAAARCVISLAALGWLSTAAAQVDEEQAATSENEAATAQGPQAASLEQARRELDEARRNLEAAAREVARLSAETVQPIITDVWQRYTRAGRRAMLGLGIEDAAQGAGARVNAVSPGGPAAGTGISVGDIIVGIDDVDLRQVGGSPSQALIDALADVEPGEAVELTVATAGVDRVVTVETGEQQLGALFGLDPSQYTRLPGNLAALNPFGRWQSMELTTLTPALGAYFGTEEGLLVVRAPDDEALMLRDGDVILDIGGREPNSPEHAMRILRTFEPGETLRLSIMRQQQRQTLEVELPPG